MTIICSKVYDLNQQPVGWVVSCSREAVSPVFPSLALAQRWAEQHYPIKGWSGISKSSRCKQVYGRL